MKQCTPQSSPRERVIDGAAGGFRPQGRPVAFSSRRLGPKRAWAIRPARKGAWDGTDRASTRLLFEAAGPFVAARTEKLMGKVAIVGAGFVGRAWAISFARG